MIAAHIHDALAQVSKLRALVLEKRYFRGYSGLARMLGGLAALAGSGWLAVNAASVSLIGHLLVWAGVLFFGLLFNYGALFLWFWTSEEADRDWRRLMPPLDAVPPLAVGAILSVALLMRRQYHFLFGVWMCCYGLTHLAHRQSLTKSNCYVGLFYLICGTVCLLAPGLDFRNPWPMGLVFFAGEIAGGYFFYRNNHRGTRRSE